METALQIKKALEKSKFRASFKLTKIELIYIERIGIKKIESHAKDFIAKRLKPLHPLNDGKQTPFRGHPVFKAQHATATCCRNCLFKWHKIAKNKTLTESEITFIKQLIMSWIKSKI